MRVTNEQWVLADTVSRKDSSHATASITLVERSERALFDWELAILESHIGIDILVGKLVEELLLVRNCRIRARLHREDIRRSNLIDVVADRILVGNIRATLLAEIATIEVEAHLVVTLQDIILLGLELHHKAIAAIQALEVDDTLGTGVVDTHRSDRGVRACITIGRVAHNISLDADILDDVTLALLAHLGKREDILGDAHLLVLGHHNLGRDGLCPVVGVGETNSRLANTLCVRIWIDIEIQGVVHTLDIRDPIRGRLLAIVDVDFEVVEVDATLQQCRALATLILYEHRTIRHLEGATCATCLLDKYRVYTILGREGDDTHTASALVAMVGCDERAVARKREGLMTEIALLGAEANPVVTLDNLNGVRLRGEDIDNLVAALIVDGEDVILIDGTQFWCVYLIALVYLACNKECGRGDNGN